MLLSTLSAFGNLESPETVKFISVAVLHFKHLDFGKALVVHCKRDQCGRWGYGDKILRHVTATVGQHDDALYAR